MLPLYRLASKWPLGLLHAIGGVLGWLTWLASPTYRRRFAENAARAGYRFGQVRAAVAHAGRMVAETPRLWFGAPVPVQWDGAERIEAAYAAGRGIVYLTPHMGCFEITAQGAATRFGATRGPITVLYRPARQAALAQVLATARQREGLETAPTTLTGVRQMIRALRAGQAVGAPFFGQPAYTMTLAARLVQQTGATPLLAWGERLPRARGYCIHVQPFPEPLAANLDTAVGQINRAMEQLIRQCPGQYLWGYGRYKTPRKTAA